jgi:hypothetical protein
MSAPDHLSLTTILEKSMNDLIIPLVTDPAGISRVSSEVIADHLGNQHKATIQLIRKYETELRRFGLLPFEMRARLPGQHGGADMEIALLNEDQCFYLLGLSKNTDTVVSLKGDMVAAFSKARKGTDLSGLDPTTALLVNNVLEMAKVKAEQAVTSNRLDHIEATISSGTGYQTISAWGKMNGAPMHLKSAQKLGFACATKCKKHGISIGKVPDERYGEVNSYPIDVINECSEKLA